MMRKRALLFANSSSALLLLHRYHDAKQRIDESLAILRETKDYPADQIKLDSEAYVTLSAWADYEARIGDSGHAIQVYEQLLTCVMASDPAPSADLRDAPRLSRLYDRLAQLYRHTGNAGRAADLQSRRLRLWQDWDRSLPGNIFIRRELAATS
jgi:tetratricopeptide (TPR) repeat protein